MVKRADMGIIGD